MMTKGELIELLDAIEDDDTPVLIYDGESLHKDRNIWRKNKSNRIGVIQGWWRIL